MRNFRLRLALTLSAFAIASLMNVPTVSADRPSYIVDAKTMDLYAASVPYAFSTPVENVHRFEARHNDFGWSGDSKNGKRRAELISRGEQYSAGQTLWTSFSFVVGPHHAPFDGGSDQNFIHQWHSVDTTEDRAPVMRVELVNGNLEIRTQSDDNHTSVVRYRALRPKDGIVHHIVVAGRLGESGHLKAWLNGEQIVDTDAPIGYYKDDEGKRPLAYPQWGLYQTNVKPPTVVYLANLEWGERNLSARVKSPLGVKVPEGGWR